MPMNLSEARKLLDVVGLDEFPMTVLFSENRPEKGFSPPKADMPTYEQEQAGGVDMAIVGRDFSCALGNIWRARKKRTAAWFSAEHFGCLGAAYWMGFNKPQLDCITNYGSHDEKYCRDYATMRRIFDEFDPEPIPTRYLVFKPLEMLDEGDSPEFVSFFVRPESLCGLHQLVLFVTNDVEAVQSPWAAACGGLVSWPMKYRKRGAPKAVLGGWDPSARQFYKTDELSFTVSWELYQDMLQCCTESFLSEGTWKTVRKKIDRSKKAWGELS